MSGTARSTGDAQAFYQGFSAQVGLRDWLAPNPRHEQLKALVGPLLAGRERLRILDVGCGAGVMTGWLTRFGHVTGTDFSAPAIDLARQLAPSADFHAGQLDELPFAAGAFGAVCAFDVLEHIPMDQRPDVLRSLRSLLAPGGLLVASTPHPRFSRWMAANRPELMQVIDEPVDLAELLAVAGEQGLELVRYDTYDLDFRRQYQLVVLETMANVGGRPWLSRSLRRRLALVGNPPAKALHRLRAKRRLRP